MTSDTAILRNVRLLYLFRFLQKSNISLPIQIIFFAQITQNYAMAMGLYGISHFTTLILELPTGCLSDKWGRKWVCCVGAFSLFLSSVFYAAAYSYPFLLIGTVLTGVHRALSSGNDETLLYETMIQVGQKNNFIEVISKMTASGQFALCVSAVLGGLFSLISLETAMYMTIIPMGLSFVISLFLVEPKHLSQDNTNFKHAWNSFKYLMRHKRLRYLSFGEACHESLSETAFMFNPIFFKLFIPVWSLGIFRALGHLFGTAGSYFAFSMTKRLGLKKTFLYCAYLNNIINILSVLAASVFSPILKLGSSFVNSMKTPPGATLMQHETMSHNRATVLSVSSLLTSIMYVFTTAFIGALADVYSAYTAMLTAYTLALFSNYFFMIALRHPSCEENEAEKTLLQKPAFA